MWDYSIDIEWATSWNRLNKIFALFIMIDINYHLPLFDIDGYNHWKNTWEFKDELAVSLENMIY